MVRKLSLRLMCAVFGMAAVGCGPDKNASRPEDMPIKATEEVDKKGRKTKVMEVSFEDPNQVKK